MRVARAALGCLLALTACAGAGAKSPSAAQDDLPFRYATAFEEEARGNPAKARDLYLDVIARAAVEEGPWSEPAIVASLDALVFRPVPGFDQVARHGALAFRIPRASLLAGEGPKKEEPAESAPSVAPALGSAYQAAAGPVARGLLARALLELGEHQGDAPLAALWRERSGCAREAAVVGPLDWAPVTGVAGPDPLEAFDAKLAPSYPGNGPFARPVVPVVARGHGCEIDLGASSAIAGVRDVVVDVDVPRAGRIGVALRARGEALLRVGGKVAVTRPYALGGHMVTRLARVDVPAGRLRLVARVGMDESGQTLEIDGWDDSGSPLKMHAPRPGEAATGRATASEVLSAPAARTTQELTLAAGAALGAGDARDAERLTIGPHGPPGLALLHARALDAARDLSSVERSERQRSAYEDVLAAWPSAWEAAVAHALLAGVRRGEGDARIETLRDLDERRAAMGPGASPLLDAFEALTSAEARLYDRAQAAYERAKTALDKSSLLADVGTVAVERSGADQAAYLCSPSPLHDRRTLSCYSALRGKGDLGAGLRELERLRSLQGGPDLYLALSLRDQVALGAADRAAATLAAMAPGEVGLTDLYSVAALSARTPPDPARLKEAAAVARDAPGALPALLRALADDPLVPFAGVAEELLREDQATPILRGAATAVLAHSERYEVDASGLVHAVLFDVRRVTGTTDVEENAQADPPDLIGHGTMRALRRRILKRDGRVIEPDPTPRASQGHADLSQLEAGDLVEAIYEGWAVPSESGQLGIDSPDLMPERTSVHKASLELVLPATLRGSLWAHPLWGKPSERSEGARRIIAYRVTDQLARRIEEGTPKMDRDVSVSFGTLRWEDVGKGLAEAIAELKETDPEVTAWARRVAGAGSSREQVTAVVAAAGTAVKEASGSILSDVGVGRAGGPQLTTARSILTSHEGSRTWLIVRALGELGIPAEVAVAENEPYSAYADYPARPGRFTHPLAIAHLGAAGGDVWIDADVAGPPLPAGHISPELRGRSAIRVDGSVTPLPQTSVEEDRDEVDIRLTLQPNGDAKGTFSIVLRGKEAQELAEVFLRTVGDDRMKVLRAVPLGWLPYADVDDVVLSSSEESWQIVLRAQVTILSYAEAVAGPKGSKRLALPGLDPLHVVYPRPISSTLGSTYGAQGKRKTALAVSHAVQYHAHRRVELPGDAKIVNLPGPLEVKSPRLLASRKITSAGKALEDDFVLGVSTGTVDPGDYEAFLAELRKTDSSFLAGARIEVH